MNIAVLAANGRSGRAFVAAALAAGHTVRAGTYHSTIEPRDNLQVMQCDATNKDQVAELLRGTDAVVSFIGHVKGSPSRVQTEAMRVLAEAMRSAGASRVVSLTGTGVRFPGDRIGLIDRFMNASITIIDPNRVNDGIEHVKILQESELEWTILRVLKLQNFASKPFVLRAHGPTRLYVNRTEVAHAVLQVLDKHDFVREAPILSRP